ncbi:hypothetical protein ABL78_2048 [Leptomonas seymouri]|uniref:Uncharacterized protein n=1 Tax=Leptomonas seymouri TaxID=5684 RepID=A0A0N1PEF6_LEPSE|nr:hypothetical protein ABL78_2048 [Leptomonas seymouri]|eukprot:KPI88854.1 hypothetical protein ABL78_2048 [Leptomonas seymouri]
MPYDSIGGLPPLPTQPWYGTVYEPKQCISSSALQNPSWRILKENSRPLESSTEPGNSFAHHKLLGGQHAPLPSTTDTSSLPLATPSSHTRSVPQRHDLPDVEKSNELEGCSLKDGNPWFARATMAEVEGRRLHSESGVAVFRTLPYATLAAAELQTTSTKTSSCFLPSFGEKSVAAKPLLEPFVNAQVLAQNAAEETWYTRRLRYLQWLRKGALVAKQKEEREESQRIRSLAQPDSSLCLSGAALMGVEGVFSGMPRNCSRLPPLDRSATLSGEVCNTVQQSESMRGCEKPDPNLLPSDRLEEGAFEAMRGDELAANPNAVAVRELFRVARDSTITPVLSSTPGLQEGDREGADDSKDDRLVDGAATSSLPGQFSTTTTVAGAYMTSSTHGPLIDDGSLYLDEDGFSFIRTGREEMEMDDEADTESVTSKSTVEPPLEFTVACLLRKRMHNTIAAFTPSSVHTLDAPPQKTKRRFLGQARLQGNVDSEDNKAAQTLRIAAATPSSSPTAIHGSANEGATGESAELTVRLPQSGFLSIRTVRRLVYEEAYERGLLLQLAFQSSPTRWYSTELPSGEDGLSFRRVYAPTMMPDAELEARLNDATAQAIQTIARPRQTEARAVAAREKNLIWSPSAVGAVYWPEQLSYPKADAVAASDIDGTIDASAVSVEVAAREKEALFGQWQRLHRNLSAQWNLLEEEQAARLPLLGQFVSCAYPEPCTCLECDQEVLNLSAIPLEPTVKPICWFTSVVLGGHFHVLQKEMLREHEEGLVAIYAEFRLLFITTYTHEKLLEEEARRFQKMMRYHEFCLRVAAHSESARDSKSNHCAICPVSASTGAELIQDGQSPITTEQRMRRLRQHRLQAFRAFDSPYFSYLVYIEVVTLTLVEEQVREMLMEEEAVHREEMATLTRMDEQFGFLLSLERCQRSWIVVMMEEEHLAMLAGPLVELQAAHKAEVQEREAEAYALKCVSERQAFMNVAIEEKHVVVEQEFAEHRILIRDIRQQLLALLVANRSAKDSVALARNWLHEQQQSALVRAEHRLRDLLTLKEEPSAFQTILVAAEESRQASERDAQHRMAQVAEADVAAAAKAALLERENMQRDPKLRPSAKLPEDGANSFTKLATTLKEDFVFFL